MPEVLLLITVSVPQVLLALRQNSDLEQLDALLQAVTYQHAAEDRLTKEPPPTLLNRFSVRAKDPHQFVYNPISPAQKTTLSTPTPAAMRTADDKTGLQTKADFHESRNKYDFTIVTFYAVAQQLQLEIEEEGDGVQTSGQSLEEMHRLAVDESEGSLKWLSLRATPLAFRHGKSVIREDLSSRGLPAIFAFRNHDDATGRSKADLGLTRK